MKRILLALLIVFTLVSPVSAATIYGTIYDINHNPLTDAFISIDSTPTQQYLTKNGEYSFNLNKGEYTLEVSYTSLEETVVGSRDIVIVEDGDFKYDILLVVKSEPVRQFDYLNTAIIVGLIVLMIIMVMHFRKNYKKKKIEVKDEDCNKVLDFIKEKDGKTTQKEIREKYPSMSEAKVSLILAELEHKKKIHKIKKGRTNLIILD